MAGLGSAAPAGILSWFGGTGMGDQAVRGIIHPHLHAEQEEKGQSVGLQP